LLGNGIIRGMSSTFLENYPTLFWDVKELDDSKHSTYIIERVLEHGTGEAVTKLLQYYPVEEIKEVVASSRRITKKTALFWQNRLNISGPIVCIQKRSIQMPKDHGNS